MAHQLDTRGVILGRLRVPRKEPQIYAVKCDSCNAVTINGLAAHETGCRGMMLFIGRGGRIFLRYRVWGLDVWGNRREGFEVNDRSHAGYVLIAQDGTDKDVIGALKSKELLGKRIHCRSIVVEGDERTLYLKSKRSDEPIYQLEVM